MKKAILNLGKALNKAEQKTINGGFSCDQYPIFLCFGPIPGCLPCSQMQNYPGADSCPIHINCDSNVPN